MGLAHSIWQTTRWVVGFEYAARWQPGSLSFLQRRKLRSSVGNLQQRSDWNDCLEISLAINPIKRKPHKLKGYGHRQHRRRKCHDRDHRAWRMPQEQQYDLSSAKNRF